MPTNPCFEQKYEKKYQSFSSENVQDLEVKISIYLNKRVFRNGDFGIYIYM